MTLPRSLMVTGWLVRDTFRQSWASGIGWLLLAISVVCTAVSLSVSVDGGAELFPEGQQGDFLPRSCPDAKDKEKVHRSGVAIVAGDVSLGFGALRVPLARDARGAVHFLELVLAGGVADSLGLLLTLVWTAGFLPGFLDARNIAVLLAKPISRASLLWGKYLSVLVFVLAHASLLVGGTWLALGVKTGIWDAHYLLCIPLLVVHFAVFFSVSLLLAVATRSTVICVFGSIVFWALAWGMNYGRYALAAADRVAPEASISSWMIWLAELGYWILPKPADLGTLLYQSLDAHDYFRPTLEAAALTSGLLAIASSLVFAGCLLIAARWQFASQDY